MLQNPFEEAIEKALTIRDEISPSTSGEIRDAIETTLHSLDCGTLRVAERQENGAWRVNQWAKKAVLLFMDSSSFPRKIGGLHTKAYLHISFTAAAAAA